MDDKRFALGKYVIDIKWKEDDDEDLSCLGKPTDRREEYVIDRKEGKLLGEYVEFMVSIPAGEVGLDMDDFYFDEPYFRDGSIRNSALYKAEVILKPIVEAAKIDDDEWSVGYDDQDETFYVELSGYRILREDLRNTWGGSETYRYFSLGNNHLPHKPSHWSHVVGDELQKVIDKYGSIENADIDYALRDWETWEGHGNTWWSMYCAVTVENEGGEELGSAYGSADTNYSWDEIRDIEIETLAEALEEAGLLKIKAKRVLENFEAGRYEVA